DRLGREHVVAEPVGMRQRDLDLLLFLEVVLLDLDFLQHVVPARLAERDAARDGDAAALADGELGDRSALAIATDIAERAQHALAELGTGIRVREQRTRGDEVRLHQRATERTQAELFEALANDLAN